mgnify:CR=1 FL=1|tara:strand:+ start:199 stop:1095 length:897 start_codon:yes stop_codon:yes gene_type:complete
MSIRKSIIPIPSPQPLIRLGGNVDGSYLLPNDLDGIEACFSPGVSNRKLFEDELAKRYKIKSFMCDYSSDISKFQTALIKDYQIFDKTFIGNKESDEFISLTNWVEKYSPDTQSDLILQMDIEGNEYSNILSTPDDIIKRFRIIIIELHGLNVFDDNQSNQFGITKDIINNTLDKLNFNHSCVHAHPNNFSSQFYDAESQLNIPYVIELTYLRNDRFTGDKNQYFKPDLPNELDITNNIYKLPIHLNINWNIDKEKSANSKLKILSDNLTYNDIQIFNKLNNEISLLKKELNELKLNK